ncbi:DUF2750 domain-containing protein [Campylobacter sp. 9BO]|uniref:DUF2750 domain-containing protein n=1 Tax=Campylobacter sp. 9BO TaxID=3424759 RepID=UPI003D3281E1
MQLYATLEVRYKNFITNIAKNEIVYALRDPKSGTYANCPSNEFQSDDGPACEVVVFFSSQTLAKACAKQEWAEYEICGFDLAEFLESWCASISQNNAVLGIDFDANLYGFEADALELVLDVIEELKRQEKSIELQDFESLDELKEQVKSCF